MRLFRRDVARIKIRKSPDSSGRGIDLLRLRPEHVLASRTCESEHLSASFTFSQETQTILDSDRTNERSRPREVQQRAHKEKKGKNKKR